MIARPGRRGVYLIGAALLVVALVGGRWLAIETAERAWASTFPGGAALTATRTLGRLLQMWVLLVAIAWATGNLFVVYRAIGSVQMPRRLGDLEIVEAVPHRILLGLTLTLGVVAGVLMSLGTGDWWRHAVLAAAPPHFGVVEETLGRDLGYYVGVLPWRSTLQTRALVLTAGAAFGVALLYAAIGSLRIRQGRLHASDHARSHVAVLLTCLALVIAWGAALDPAEVIAGLHGPVDQAALTVRVPGAAFVGAVAIIAAIVSLVWGWRDRTTLILGTWAAVLLAVTGNYVLVPGVVRASGNEEGPSLARQRAALERIAFDVTRLADQRPPEFPSAEDGIETIPLWDPVRVGSVAGAPASAVALRARPSGRPSWLVASLPPGAAYVVPRVAVETDTGLAISRLPVTDSAVWFGPGVRGFAVASPDSWPALRPAGIPLVGAWRRAALAWTLQGAALARSETDDRVLLWRRDAVERLGHLVPFARFGDAAPVIDGGALWWVSWGYVTSEAFPLARPLPWREGEDPVLYLRAGLLGAVRVATGETHVWLAPGYDSLTAAWARHFAPLIEPAQRVPAAMLAQLGYPVESFRVAVAQLARAHVDAWTMRPRAPFQVVAPGAQLWTAVGFETGAPPQFVGLCAGTITAQGPRLHLWQPERPKRLPGELVGSTIMRPGELRIWPAGGAVFTMQAQFVHPMHAEAPPPLRVAQVYISLDERRGVGSTARAALRGGEAMPVDTSLAARWDRARRLAAQADSALSAGDLELFGRLFRALARELAPAPRPR